MDAEGIERARGAGPLGGGHAGGAVRRPSSRTRRSAGAVQRLLLRTALSRPSEARLGPVASKRRCSSGSDASGVPVEPCPCGPRGSPTSTWRPASNAPPAPQRESCSTWTATSASMSARCSPWFRHRRWWFTAPATRSSPSSSPNSSRSRSPTPNWSPSKWVTVSFERGGNEAAHTAIETWLTGQAAPEFVPVERVLSTVLFTDFVGSTAMATRLGDASMEDAARPTRRCMSTPRGAASRSPGQVDRRWHLGDLRWAWPSDRLCQNDRCQPRRNRPADPLPESTPARSNCATVTLAVSP